MIRQVAWSVASTAIHISRCSADIAPKMLSSRAIATVRTSSQPSPPSAENAASSEATVCSRAVTGRATSGGLLRRKPTSRATIQSS